MQKPAEFSPIIAEYHRILDQWFTTLPGWRSCFLNGRLNAGVFECVLMYPFHSGTVSGAPLELKRRPSDFSKHTIPVIHYGQENCIPIDYTASRNRDTFQKNMTTPKKAVRSRDSIPQQWLCAIAAAQPWENDSAEELSLLASPYLDLLERLTLEAAQKGKERLADEFPSASRQLLTADYICDLLLALEQAFADHPEPDEAQRKYAFARGTRLLEALLEDCTAQLSLLTDALFELSSKKGSATQQDLAARHISLESALEQSCTRLIQAEADQCPTDYAPAVWRLYRQYFIDAESSAQDCWHMDAPLDKYFCDRFGHALADTPGSPFDRWHKQLTRTALLLWAGVCLHFSGGRTNLFAYPDEVRIRWNKNYYTPQDLPLSMRELRNFLGEHSPCLLVGGGGSGKSTYLQKLIDLQQKGTDEFSLAVCIPLRFLVSEQTGQTDAITQSLDSNLIWQKIRQMSTSLTTKTLSHIEQNLNRSGGRIAPVLLLLDGYNEILSLRNEDALARLRKDIQWLISQHNVRVLMTCRVEQDQSAAVLKRSLSWFFPQTIGRERQHIFFLNYDPKKMARILRSSGVQWRQLPSRLVQLLETRPMYLNAIQYLNHPGQVSQYNLLNALYRQRWQAALDSPLVRDCRRSHWLALYTLILPELAFRMVEQGRQVLERHQLCQELTDLLTEHRKGFGDLYWWYGQDTCDETTDYPFKYEDIGQVADWIMHAVLDSDRIIDKNEDNTLSFFHEDIRNYLAARHIAQRFLLYIKCAELPCCYNLPVCWEHLPREMLYLTYEALAEERGLELIPDGEPEVVQLLEKAILPTGPILPDVLRPGDWMRLQLAEMIQEYERQHQPEALQAFAARTKPLADRLAQSQTIQASIPVQVRPILVELLCQLSRYERRDQTRSIPKAAYKYGRLAIAMSTGVPPLPGRPALWKAAKHYLAWVVLRQAQYLWKYCGPDHEQEGNRLFRKGVHLLRQAATTDSDSPGYAMSSTLLGYWCFTPPPILTQRDIYWKEIGGINYGKAFHYFIQSVMLSIVGSSNRAYAGLKCVAMLLDQQVFLPENHLFSNLSSFLTIYQQEIALTGENAGHEILSLTDQRLTLNLRAVGLLLNEVERFLGPGYLYYIGLYHLYCGARNPAIRTDEWVTARDAFENAQGHGLKNALCLSFMDAVLQHDHTAWNEAMHIFSDASENELKVALTEDSGTFDTCHKINFQVSYQNLLHMLKETFPTM